MALVLFFIPGTSAAQIQQGTIAGSLVGPDGAAVSAGLQEIRLHTAQSNLSALELFLKRGFRLERRMPRFYRGVYDACVLTKQLS